jgi:hypothetical protein
MLQVIPDDNFYNLLLHNMKKLLLLLLPLLFISIGNANTDTVIFPSWLSMTDTYPNESYGQIIRTNRVNSSYSFTTSWIIFTWITKWILFTGNEWTTQITILDSWDYVPSVSNQYYTWNILLQPQNAYCLWLTSTSAAKWWANMNSLAWVYSTWSMFVYWNCYRNWAGYMYWISKWWWISQFKTISMSYAAPITANIYYNGTFLSATWANIYISWSIFQWLTWSWEYPVFSFVPQYRVFLRYR